MARPQLGYNPAADMHMLDGPEHTLHTRQMEALRWVRRWILDQSVTLGFLEPTVSTSLVSIISRFRDTCPRLWLSSRRPGLV